MITRAVLIRPRIQPPSSRFWCPFFSLQIAYGFANEVRRGRTRQSRLHTRNARSLTPDAEHSTSPLKTNWERDLAGDEQSGILLETTTNSEQPKIRLFCENAQKRRRPRGLARQVYNRQRASVRRLITSSRTRCLRIIFTSILTYSPLNIHALIATPPPPFDHARKSSDNYNHEEYSRRLQPNTMIQLWQVSHRQLCRAPAGEKRIAAAATNRKVSYARFAIVKDDRNGAGDILHLCVHALFESIHLS